MEILLRVLGSTQGLTTCHIAVKYLQEDKKNHTHVSSYKVFKKRMFESTGRGTTVENQQYYETTAHFVLTKHRASPRNSCAMHQHIPAVLFSSKKKFHMFCVANTHQGALTMKSFSFRSG